MFAAKTTRIACALFALAAFAPAASAASYTFDTSSSAFTPGYDNQGWWSATLPNYDTNTAYTAGYSSTSAVRGFLTFDLGALDLANQQIASATLQLRKYYVEGTDASESVAFYDVSTPAQVLNNNVGSSAAIFDDLGSGKGYGSVTVNKAGPTTDIVSYSLGAAALTDIAAAAGGYFSIGASCFTCTAGQSVFSVSSSTGMQRLVLETIPAVPEPSTYAMLGIGLAALAFLRRRKVV